MFILSQESLIICLYFNSLYDNVSVEIMIINHHMLCRTIFFFFANTYKVMVLIIIYILFMTIVLVRGNKVHALTLNKLNIYLYTCTIKYKS